MTSVRAPQLRSWLSSSGLGPAPVSAPGDGGRARWARHPLVVDLALALMVAAFAALLDAFGPEYRAASAPAWDLALAFPLVLRRRRPALAAALIAVVCLAQWLANVLATGDIAFLIALYSLGAYERRRWAISVAVVVAEIGVVMAIERWATASNPLVGGLTATGTVTASWVVGVYVRMRRAYVASMRERAETAERERDSRTRIAVAAERARLAREMHDVIAHSLSVMITLNDAAAAVESSPQARETIAQASDVGRHALTEMRRVLGVLRDGEPATHAPQPGVAELADLVSMVRSAGLAVELAVVGDLAPVPPTAQLACYRIVQESLTNVLKHARNVEQVTVEVARRGSAVELRIDNDGSAVLGAVDPSPGHGLSGMDERARLFEGRLVAGPRPGGGWRVSARLELDPAAVRP